MFCQLARFRHTFKIDLRPNRLLDPYLDQKSTFQAIFQSAKCALPNKSLENQSQGVCLMSA